MVRCSLALLIAILIAMTASGQHSRSGVFILASVTPPSSFVTLAESTTFGPTGTVVPITGRFSVPNYIGPPKAPGEFANSNTSLKDGGCSTDGTTQAAIEALLDGGGAVADDTVIWLPDDCKVRWFTSTSGGDFDFRIPDARDDVMLYCADPTVCGIEQWFTSLTADYYGEIRTRLFAIGTNMPVSGDPGFISCDFDASSYTHNSKMIQADCSVTVTGTNAWGPGDIVRLSTARITGYGSSTPYWMTRITCVDGPTEGPSDRFPAVDPGGLCDELTDDNQVQLQNPPPMNYHPNAYYWGDEGLGESFTPYSSEGGAGSGTYAATSGHTIERVEQMGSGRCDIVASGICGIGTGTDNIPENFWFSGMSWDMAPGHEVGGGMGWWYNAFGGGYYQNQIYAVGRSSLITFGNSQSLMAGDVSIHSSDFHTTGGNIKAVGRILEITKTDPVTIRVAADGVDASDWTQAEGRTFEFTSDVAEPEFAGKRFDFTRSSFTAGSPGYYTLTLTGFNDSTFDVDTTLGGYAVWYDRFGGSTIYYNLVSSNIQTINNSFRNTRQHSLYQGCSGCVYAANYVKTEPDEDAPGRGPFFHGNRGACGDIFEMNDQDHAFIIQDSGNGEPSGHGEGCSHVWYKNRKSTPETTTWPTGTATSGSYATNAFMNLLQTGQNGAANDMWTILGNSSEDALWSGTIDDCDNNDGDDGSSSCVDPGTLWNPLIYRNRCASCNQDANVETALRQPATQTDILATEDGDNSSGVPAAWTSASEPGAEPTSIFWTEKPEFWCNEAMTFGEMGAYYDDFGGTLGKLPAQIRYEGGTCTLP